tara:strand:+ start:823 stop:1299 length:477 start_codon:yes stop_codon:yes gene_type:complete
MMKAITLMLTVAGMLLVTHNANAGQHSKFAQADKSYPSKRSGHSYQKMLAGVELSAEQRQQLHQLLADHRANKPERAQASGKRGELRQLIQADYFDETAVSELLQQQHQQRMTRQLAQLKLRHQVYQLLTPEQREKMLNKQKQRHQKRQQQQQTDANG